MLLTNDQVEQYLIGISTGEKLDYIDDKMFIFKFPSNRVKQRAELVYKKEYEEAIADGLLNNQDLQKLLIERNIFTPEDEKKLERLNSKLDAQIMLLAKTTVVKANQERIKKVIDGIRTEIHQLEYKRTSKLAMSADVKANEERSLYICWACTFNENGNLFWERYEDFKRTKAISYRDKILTSFLDLYFGLPTRTVRFIARSNLWRIRYVNSQKISDPLFGVPSIEYTTDMLSLAYWSNYYDNIYQMMPEDKPSDLVIEDDEALDAYMKSFYEERTREDASRRSKTKSPGKLSAFNQEEVIVTASNELWQDIDYNKPREAQKLKERADIRKRTKHG